MSSEEARAIARDNPLSFLHVSKPEIDLPPGTDLHSSKVYAKGRENFESLIAQGALRQDAQPGFYLYRQVMGEHSQIGLVAVASCEEYLGGTIKKHELTRPDKEDDRVRHIEALNSQTLLDSIASLILIGKEPDGERVGLSLMRAHQGLECPLFALPASDDEFLCVRLIHRLV